MLKGLTSIEAQGRLKTFGYNELSSSRSKSIWTLVIEVMKEPMFLLLITCGILYMILGDYKEGIILISTISIIILITFLQHRKTEKALEALKKLSSPRALVFREGIEKRIPGREVVPDDIVILNEGDRIPADGILLEAFNFQVDESILTGESVPVPKGTGEILNIVLSGTLVTKGRAVMQVQKTGMATEFGKIGSSLESIEEEQTPLQKEMAKLIRNLGIVGIVLCISVVLLFYFTRGNFIQSLLNGLSAAMAILPEEFPVVLTVFFALGAWRLSKVNVLTRKPSAIETLGSTTVLCSDKTGTITQNKMIVAAVLSGSEKIPKERFSENDHARNTLRTAYLATHPGSVDPMEKAIINSHLSNDKEPEELPLLKEFSFSHELLAMTRLYQTENGSIAYCKGAPETIFGLCGIEPSKLKELTEHVNKLASEGLRVIAVAKSERSTTDIPEVQTDFEFTFEGLIGLEDPIRPEVPQAIEECRSAGIRVIMITGDFPETARNIGRQIGLNTDGLITGDQLDQLTDEQLAETIKTVSIIARVKPEQKLRIVEALKRDKEIVAMTGDGVNDAPALKAAHIGVAMGNKGTDVAREASSLVLLDDDFASIVGAVRMGRKIFDNLQKAMSYVLAIHVPIIGLTLLPAFFADLPIILMPLHIVFMELIIDPVSSVAFELEEEEKGLMEHLPRSPDESFFGIRRIGMSLLNGILLLAAVLCVYLIGKNTGLNEEQVRALSFSTLIIGNLFLILSKLSKTRSFLHIVSSKNWASKLILIVAVLSMVVILMVPGMSHLFNVSYPGIGFMLLGLASATAMLLILELIKLAKKRAASN
jgi:Ca2+-transporting ATPase